MRESTGRAEPYTREWIPCDGHTHENLAGENELCTERFCTGPFTAEVPESVWVDRGPRVGERKVGQGGCPPADLCSPIATPEGTRTPYSDAELTVILEGERALTLEETQIVKKNRTESRGDRAAIEAWYQAECHSNTRAPRGFGSATGAGPATDRYWEPLWIWEWLLPR